MSAINPFSQELPVKVYLRCRSTATVVQIVEDSPFPLLGHLGTAGRSGDLSGIVDDGQPSIDLEGQAPASWRIDGRFAEDGKAHPCDIVGVVVHHTAHSLSVVPFAGGAA